MSQYLVYSLNNKDRALAFSFSNQYRLSGSNFIPIELGGLKDQRFTPVHTYEEIQPQTVDSNSHLAATGSSTDSRISEVPQYIEGADESNVVSSHENEPESSADTESDQTNIIPAGDTFDRKSTEDSKFTTREIVIPTVIVDEAVANEEIGLRQGALDCNEEENTPKVTFTLNRESLFPSQQTLSEQDDSDNQLEDEDDTYDVPQILVRIISSRANSPEGGQININLKDPSTLFDDPGYMAGILIKNHDPDVQMHTDDTSGASQVDKQSFTSTDDKHVCVLPDAQVMPTVHVDREHFPSLENLIQDDLADLDPDIAACIKSDQ